MTLTVWDVFAGLLGLVGLIGAPVLAIAVSVDDWFDRRRSAVAKVPEIPEIPLRGWIPPAPPYHRGWHRAA